MRKKPCVNPSNYWTLIALLDRGIPWRRGGCEPVLYILSYSLSKHPVQPAHWKFVSPREVPLRSYDVVRNVWGKTLRLSASSFQSDVKDPQFDMLPVSVLNTFTDKQASKQAHKDKVQWESLFLCDLREPLFFVWSQIHWSLVTASKKANKQAHTTVLSL